MHDFQVIWKTSQVSLKGTPGQEARGMQCCLKQVMIQLSSTKEVKACIELLAAAVAKVRDGLKKILKHLIQEVAC